MQSAHLGGWADADRKISPEAVRVAVRINPNFLIFRLHPRPGAAISSVALVPQGAAQAE